MRSIVATKDKALARTTKEKRQAEDHASTIAVQMQDEITRATNEAKIWEAKSVLQAMIKLVSEANDPAFDKSSWNIAQWKQSLADLSGRKDEAGDNTETTFGAQETEAMDTGKDATAEEDAAKTGNEG